MEVWENAVNVIKHFQALCKSKQRTKNNSYDTLVTHQTDVLMKIKIQFFVDVASMMSWYLKQFQTDNPMMPFASEILDNPIRMLM